MTLVVGAVGLEACSSSDSGTPTATGGTTSHTGGTSSSNGGTSSSNGGTSSSLGGTSSSLGGTSSSTGGTSSSTGGSGGAGSGFACKGTKPTAATITSFGDLVASTATPGQLSFMAGIPGGTYTYQPGDVTVKDSGMALNVSGMVKNYDGFGIYFNDCTDASAYTGVSFNIKGNVGTKGTVSFRIQTNADTAASATNMKGTCAVPAGTTDTYPLCHAAAFDIPVTAGGGVVSVKFSDLTGGMPVAGVDGKDVNGLEWAFNWAGTTDTAYAVDVTVDDIMFTGGSTGGTGAGGAGGSGGAATGGGGAGGTGGAAAGSGGTGG